MRSIGFPELLVILGAIAVIGAIPALRAGGVRLAGPTLVLRKFLVDEASPSGMLVEIAGRASGFIGWLLTVFGLEAETTFALKADEIRFQGGSLAGQVQHVVPLTSVASTHCGFHRPIGALIFAMMFGLSALAALAGDALGTGILLLLLGGACVVFYSLQKKLVIGLETAGGLRLGLTFKRSVIENVSAGMPQALAAIDVINRRIAAKG
jgi:hypothetical protein